MNGRLRELDIRVLINKLFMQKAERLILLTYVPLFLVELNINDILSVLPIIDWVIVNSGWFDCNIQGNLEEERPWKSVFFAASFNMLNEDLCREENLTEFALHRLRMFEYSLIHLYRVQFLL